ncbi:MAG: UDP-glucose 4-epimerase GalE [Spirochaetota bacterium]
MEQVLVTGGAGYIGSHVVKLLGARGYHPVTLDNLSTGSREAVLCGDLVEADLAEEGAVRETLRRCRPRAVMHLAASIRVDESVRKPLAYYRNNALNTFRLLELLLEEGVRLFIFSSTAAVYGIPAGVPVGEQAPLQPINPYGASKTVCEYLLRDVAPARGLRFVSLRYFNVAGADGEGRIGQRCEEASHLITRALKAAKGELDRLQIFGTDYDTRDGTCIRDYIHVEDIAEAHLLALEHLARGGRSGAYNCGYGHGYTVREVLETVKKVTGVDFPVEETGRRAGDPPALVADSGAIRRELGWRPRRDDLEYIVRTAWRWERGL